VRYRGEVTTKIRFTSAILPKWARRTKSLDALLPRYAFLRRHLRTSKALSRSRST
jgi:hypothetical protein